MMNSRAVERRSTRRIATLWGRGACALALIALTAGCAGFNLRKELGVVGKGPDPFTVVRNKPLTMPGDTSKLPTPKPGAPSRVAPTPAADARAALVGKTPSTTSAAPSASEAALLKSAGAEGASDEIRTKLKKEKKKKDPRLLDGVISAITGDSSKPAEDPLDPAEEARRLSEKAKKTTNPELVVPAKKK